MTRTLYLNDRDRIHLQLDGSSLLVTSPESAERRFPLRMVGRVVVFGNIMLDSDVLTSLAVNNIPVFFISRRVRSFSISLNAYHAMSWRSLNLYLITRNKEKVQEFMDWAKKKRKFIEYRVAKRLCKYRLVGNMDYQEVISFFTPDKDRWVTVKSTVLMLAWSLITEELLRRELNPHHGILHLKTSFGLVRDYAYIIRPEIDLQCLQFFRTDSLDSLIKSSSKYPLLTSNGIHNIINRFENRQYMMKEITQDITNKIFELMA